MSSALANFPGVYIRDYLDIDGTFAVTVQSYSMSAGMVIDLYQTVVAFLTELLYDDVTLEGIVRLEGKEGFWVKIGA